MHIAYYQQKPEEVLRELKTGRHGLSEHEAAQRLKEYGLNELPAKKKFGKLSVFINQFKSVLVYILLIAALLNSFIGHLMDTYVILAAVFLNVILGFFQEIKARNSLAKLKSIISLEALVLRDDQKKKIAAKYLVPGDIILLEEGAKVPADARLLKIQALQVNESSLTGESYPVDKEAAAIKDKTPLAERKNMVYQGTMVTSGRGEAVVCQTGSETEIGRVAALVKDVAEDLTPLQKRINIFSKKLGFFILFVCLAILLIGLLAGRPMAEMFSLAVAIAVSAIPEGLLVSVTVILAVGMQRMLKQKALMRRLVAAETLGSTTVICADKTGTLTEGKMSLAKIITVNEEVDFSKEFVNLADKKEAGKTLEAVMLCNNAFAEDSGVVGEPTEAALITGGQKVGWSKSELEKKHPRLDEKPFESTHKYMVTLHGKDKDEAAAYYKGAPEAILGLSAYFYAGDKAHKLNKERLVQLKAIYEGYSEKGYRLLGVAFQEVHTLKRRLEDLKEHLNKIVFLGFIVLEDPLRSEAKETLAATERAGLKTVVITGDHPLTARQIAAALGLPATGDSLMEGHELEDMPPERLKEKVDKINIYARVSPKDKLRIVKAWQERGEVVAMTGDGINDAPALKQADIGVALGSGTDVAKETADIVLLDNNFKTILRAVEEGRVIFDNLKKVILYLMSDSFSEVFIISFSLVLGLFILDFPLPLLAAQILWINLVTDSFPYMALTMEPPREEIMLEKVKERSNKILDFESKFLIFLISFVAGAGTLAAFYYFWRKFGDLDQARTVAFTLLAIDSLLYVFSCRDLRASIFTKKFFANKYLLAAVVLGLGMQLLAVYLPFFQKVFRTVALGAGDWIFIIAACFLLIILIEIVKYVFIVKRKTA